MKLEVVKSHIQYSTVVSIFCCRVVEVACTTSIGTTLSTYSVCDKTKQRSHHSNFVFDHPVIIPRQLVN